MFLTLKCLSKWSLLVILVYDTAKWPTQLLQKWCTSGWVKAYIWTKLLPKSLSLYIEEVDLNKPLDVAVKKQGSNVSIVALHPYFQSKFTPSNEFGKSIKIWMESFWRTQMLLQRHTRIRSRPGGRTSKSPTPQGVFEQKRVRSLMNEITIYNFQNPRRSSKPTILLPEF